jgi:hypothetical protein
MEREEQNDEVADLDQQRDVEVDHVCDRLGEKRRRFPG